MIKLYSNHCPKCKVLEKLLNQNNIEYEVIEDMSDLLGTGISFLPVLKINDHDYLEFSRAIQWVERQKGN